MTIYKIVILFIASANDIENNENNIFKRLTSTEDIFLKTTIYIIFALQPLQYCFTVKQKSYSTTYSFKQIL